MSADEMASPNRYSDAMAHGRAMTLPIAVVVRELVDVLGATTVAAIAGVAETRAVAQWTNGRQPQRPHVLRFTLQIACMLAAAGSRDVVRAWFAGSNPSLDDAVPALLLRNRPLHEIQGPMMAAARAFLAYR